jgi:hypothetical protein
MVIKNNNIISIMNEEIPKADLEFLMLESLNTLLSNKPRALRYFVIYEEGDTVVDIPSDCHQRIKYIDMLLSYLEKTEAYEKCQELLLFKNLAIRHWGIK